MSVPRFTILIALYTFNCALANISQNVELIVTCASTNLVPYEPLLLEIEISNKHATNAFSIPGRWEEELHVCFRNGREKHLSPILKWWRPAAIKPPLPDIALLPGEKKMATMNLYPFGRDYNLLFIAGQSYEIQILLGKTLSSPTLVSQALSITIEKPSPIDSAAAMTLASGGKLPLLLLPETLAFESVDKKSSEDFILSYGQSRLAKYIANSEQLRDSHLSSKERESIFKNTME